MQNRLENRPGVKSELFQELEDQCYLVLKLEVEIHTFAIVGGPKVDLTFFKNSAEEFYPHETLSTPMKLSSPLSSSIQCHVSVFNVHKIL
jgi:hypothetical protein